MEAGIAAEGAAWYQSFLGGISVKKAGLVLAILLLLSGCKAKAAETAEYVEDGLQTGNPNPYVIVFGVPEDVVQTTFGEEGNAQLYEAVNGDYIIVTEVLSATSVEEAVAQISGKPYESLQVMKLQHRPMPEYHFAWASTGEEGDSVSRATLIAGEDYYYVMTMTQKTGLGNQYAETEEYVFSTFSLTANDVI